MGHRVGEFDRDQRARGSRWTKFALRLRATVNIRKFVRARNARTGTRSCERRWTEEGVTHPTQPGLSPLRASTAVSCLPAVKPERGCCSFLDDRLLAVHHLLHVADFPHLPHSRCHCRRRRRHCLAATRPLVLARGCRRVGRGRTSRGLSRDRSPALLKRLARGTQSVWEPPQSRPPGRTCTGLARRIVA